MNTYMLLSYLCFIFLNGLSELEGLNKPNTILKSRSSVFGGHAFDASQATVRAVFVAWHEVRDSSLALLRCCGVLL